MLHVVNGCDKQSMFGGLNVMSSAGIAGGT